jgi:hypothetical protein
MAKISMVKQFESNINSVSEVKNIGKVKRSKNRRGNMEYSAEVIFAGHENNAFHFYWDTAVNDYLVCRSEVCRHDGFISHRTEVFNPEYYRNGNLAEVSAFIKETWDKQNPRW